MDKHTTVRTLPCMLILLAVKCCVGVCPSRCARTGRPSGCHRLHISFIEPFRGDKQAPCLCFGRGRPLVAPFCKPGYIWSKPPILLLLLLFILLVEAILGFRVADCRRNHTLKKKKKKLKYVPIASLKWTLSSHPRTGEIKQY